jgi:hypothetical protein
MSNDWCNDTVWFFRWIDDSLNRKVLACQMKRVRERPTTATIEPQKRAKGEQNSDLRANAQDRCNDCATISSATCYLGLGGILETHAACCSAHGLGRRPTPHRKGHASCSAASHSSSTVERSGSCGQYKSQRVVIISIWRCWFWWLQSISESRSLPSMTMVIRSGSW